MHTMLLMIQNTITSLVTFFERCSLSLGTEARGTVRISYEIINRLHICIEILIYYHRLVIVQCNLPSLGHFSHIFLIFLTTSLIKSNSNILLHRNMCNKRIQK